MVYLPDGFGIHLYVLFHKNAFAHPPLQMRHSQLPSHLSYRRSKQSPTKSFNHLSQENC